MKLKLFYSLIFCLLLLNCEPSHVEPKQQPGILAKKAKTGTRLSTSTDFRYEDSIVYLRSSPLLAPASVPVGATSFSASPGGLAIDTNTGVVDMSRSETGMWFTVVCKVRNTTYQTRLMISGIEYKGATYDLQQQQQRFLTPYYNGSTSNVMPSGTFQVNDRKVIINRATGVINLTATVANIPIGGYKEVIVSYQLNDRSNQAVNKIRLKLYHRSGLSTLGTAPVDEDLERDRPPAVVIISN